MPQSPETYDFIVVGAGSAGCVLADRLSANGRYTVCVVEAGRADNWIWFQIPAGYLYAIGNPRADWMYRTGPVPGLNGRDLAYPRGRTLGGSSAINAMIYMRGQAADYDSWRDAGLPGWGWTDLLPLFKRQEDSWRGASRFHGQGGRWKVSQPRIRWQVLDAFQDAVEQAGIPRTSDFNTGDNEGSGYFDVNQFRGRRWSAARGFLLPALRRRNVHLVTEAEVESVVLTDGRASGIRFRRGGELRTIAARREVILSSGAVGTPLILERSGIGRPDVLGQHGIVVQHALAGVGENLQDHLQLRPIFEVSNVPTMNELFRSLFWKGMTGLQFALLRRGALTMAPSQLGVFTRSSPHQRRANLQFHVQPLSLDKFGDTLHDFPAITVSVCNLRPSSRGSVHLAGNGMPAIAPNYLATADDRQVAADAIRAARRIMAQPAMAPFAPKEFRPGPQLETTEQLVAAAAEIGTTIFHPVGTARMGRDDDPEAVVDARLRVRGLAGLRVADASVMPTITSGNTNSPTMVIAEKAADEILAAAR